MLRLFAFCSCLTLAMVCFAPLALADSAAAEARFREGLKLMEDKNYDAACPKLAESNRLDAASGTLLALALCYERAGKTASAWGSYTDAVAQAKLEKRADREKAAEQKVKELEPKLSKLTVVVSAELKQIGGLTLTRDGEALGAGSWNSPTPVDPGKHRIEASAPGYKSFTATVELGADGDQKSLEVSPLEKAESGAPAQTTPSAPVAEKDTSKSSLKTYGLIAGGVGVVAVGVGTVFALNAKKTNHDSNSDCTGNVCGDTGYSLRQDARSAGNIATIAFVAGGVLVATGVTLYVVGGSQKSQETARARKVELVPAVAPGACGGFLMGSF